MFFSNPFSKNLVFDNFEEKNCSGTFFSQSERFFTSRIDLYSASERFFTPRNVFHCPCKRTKSCHFSDLENPFVLHKMLRNFEQFWMLFERSCIRTFFNAIGFERKFLIRTLFLRNFAAIFSLCVFLVICQFCDFPRTNSLKYLFVTILKSCIYLRLEIYLKNTKTDPNGKKCSRDL